jgi:hypothetical protein
LHARQVHASGRGISGQLLVWGREQHYGCNLRLRGGGGAASEAIQKHTAERGDQKPGQTASRCLSASEMRGAGRHGAEQGSGHVARRAEQ